MKQLLLLAFLLPGVMWAKVWTLDECEDYAKEHSLTVKARIIERMNGENAVTSDKDKFLPNVQASAGQSWDFGRGLTSENTYANRNTSSFNWNVGMSLPLFQGMSRWRQLEYDKASLTQMLQQVEAAREDVTLNIMTQYLQVLYAGEMHDVAIEQARISRVQLEHQKTLFENGKVPESDVIQAQSQLAQDEVTVVTTANDKKLALVELARLMELDSDIEDFDVAPIPDMTPEELNPDNVYQRALQNNHGILASRQGIEVAEKGISVAKTGWFPSLSFSAGMGSQYYRLSGIDNPSFGKQMRENLSKQLGFTLSVPLFDGLSTRNSVRNARVRKLSAELDYDQQTSALFKSIRQAYYEATSAQQKLVASSAALDATKEALRVMTDKYEYGKANATEFEQAKANYIKSLAENTQARYELALRRRILEFYNK